MTQPVILTFLFHPEDCVAKDFVKYAIDRIDQLGGGGGGIRMRIPVRIRSEALKTEGNLRPIAPSADRLDVIVFLQSQLTEADPAPWIALLDTVRRNFAEPDRLLFLSVPFDNVPPPKEFGELQSIRWVDWMDLSTEASQVRLLIRILNAIRERLNTCLLYTSPSPRDRQKSRMPSSA